MRKIILMGSAAAIASLFAVSARAAVPKVDVSQSTIRCETLFATMGVKPVLTLGPSAAPVVIKVKGTVAGCTVLTGNTATVLSGKLSGSLTAPAGTSCTALASPTAVTGTLTIKWAADKTTPLMQGASTITINQVSGGLFQGPGTMGANVVGQFSLGVSLVSGAFAGTDGGATSSIVGATSEDVGNLLGQCVTPDFMGTGKGIKLIHLGMGENILQ